MKNFFGFRNFSVENSQSNYRLHVQGYNGTAGEIRFKRFNNVFVRSRICEKDSQTNFFKAENNFELQFVCIKYQFCKILFLLKTFFKYIVFS